MGNLLPVMLAVRNGNRFRCRRGRGGAATGFTGARCRAGRPKRLPSEDDRRDLPVGGSSAERLAVGRHSWFVFFYRRSVSVRPLLLIQPTNRHSLPTSSGLFVALLFRYPGQVYAAYGVDGRVGLRAVAHQWTSVAGLLVSRHLPFEIPENNPNRLGDGQRGKVSVPY